MDYYSEVYEAQDNPPGDAHGWIQWKGTSACIDLHCKCGALGHVDGAFFYAYECNACGRKYAVGQVVKLIELTPEQATYQAGRHGFQSDSSLGPNDAVDEAVIEGELAPDHKLLDRPRPEE
jgi:hypothetical protein